MSLKAVDNRIEVSTRHFNPGTKVPIKNMSFFLGPGGLGDYINMIPAFLYMAETMNFLQGKLFVPDMVLELYKKVMAPYSHWRVHIESSAKSYIKEEEVFHPSYFTKYINSHGANLLDLGFIYFVNEQKAPDDYNFLPNLEHLGEGGYPELPKDYVVFTPGATAQTRTMPPDAFNALVSHVLEKGITPVFLGKSDLKNTDKEKYEAYFDKDYDLSNGIDLIDKTSLFQTLKIIAESRAIIGLDNGLLHLAGCTQAPIVFGLNIATRAHREIRRENGRTIYIEIPHEVLNCVGCQSNQRHHGDHDYRKCIYTHYSCLKALFRDDCKEWKAAIDVALS